MEYWEIKDYPHLPDLTIQELKSSGWRSLGAECPLSVTTLLKDTWAPAKGGRGASLEKAGVVGAWVAEIVPEGRYLTYAGLSQTLSLALVFVYCTVIGVLRAEFHRLVFHQDIISSCIMYCWRLAEETTVFSYANFNGNSSYHLNNLWQFQGAQVCSPLFRQTPNKKLSCSFMMALFMQEVTQSASKRWKNNKRKDKTRTSASHQRCKHTFTC